MRSDKANIVLRPALKKVQLSILLKVINMPLVMSGKINIGKVLSSDWLSLSSFIHH